MNLELDRTAPAVSAPEDSHAPLIRDLLSRGPGSVHYVFVQRVGADPTTIVYAAYDPDLDRKVTIELLRPRTGEEARFLREARILAGLVHPNIITTHDVGSQDGYAWIAAEFVSGQSLDSWARARPRLWTELLQALRDAAHGLAAAHAAGLVHRAFRPAHVKIGDDGRVRVSGFDLARGRLSDGEPEAAAVRPGPAYTAPEQWLGGEGEAAADQFAWCVSAWELLYGERPFAGEAASTLAAEVVAGRVRRPAHGRSVPRWVHHVLVRGLAREPSRRWPDMTALLAALDGGRERARRRRAGLVVLGLVALAPIVLAARNVEHARRVAGCEREGAAIDAVWDEDARARVRVAFQATGVRQAEANVEKLRPWLDRHAGAWRAARVEVCRHAEVTRDWDVDTQVRALWCLDDRRMALVAQVEQLTRVDAAAVYRAVAAAASLASDDRCIDREWLLRQPSPPSVDGDALARVRAEVAHAESLIHGGQYVEALSAAAAARAHARTLAWSPLVAAAHRAEGLALFRSGADAKAEAALIAAYTLAARAGAWTLASQAASELVQVVGYALARPEEGRDWFRHAEVAAAHAGDPTGLLEAKRIGALSTVLDRIGEYDEAAALLRRGLAVDEQILGPDHPDLGLDLNNLGGMLLATQDYAEARAVLERSVEVYTQALGEEHPELARSLGNLASAHVGRGDLTSARRLHERALAIKENTLGPDSPSVANSLNNLALVHYHAGSLSEARALHLRALAIRERAYGPEHLAVTESLANISAIDHIVGNNRSARELRARTLAILERVLGPDHPEVGGALENLAISTDDPGERTRLFARARSILERAFGPDHPRLADIHRNIGESERGRGATERARAAFEQALRIYEKADAGSVDVADALTRLAVVDLTELRPREAASRLERALSIYDRTPGIQTDEPEAHFVLARALVDGGGDRSRAIAAAEHARDVLRAAQRKDLLDEVEAWLAAHPR